jgi:hypothetical protein
MNVPADGVNFKHHTDGGPPVKPLLLRMALQYAALGLPVIPLHEVLPTGQCSCGRQSCTSKGKHPRTPHGCKDGSTDADTIAGWWERWPTANVGICTGRQAGIFVVGPDGQAGIDALAELERQHGSLPRTPLARTGSGGCHLVFRFPAELIGNARNHRDLPIDIRGEGGYIVAAPSRNANGLYEWVNDPDETDLADAPDWLLCWCRKEGASASPEQAPAAPANGHTINPFVPKASNGPSVLKRAAAYVGKMPPAVSGRGGHNQTMEVARAAVWGFNLGVEGGYNLLATHYNPSVSHPGATGSSGTNARRRIPSPTTSPAAGCSQPVRDRARRPEVRRLPQHPPRGRHKALRRGRFLRMSNSPLSIFHRSAGSTPLPQRRPSVAILPLWPSRCSPH